MTHRDSTDTVLEPAHASACAEHASSSRPDGAPTWVQRRIRGAIVWYQRAREGRPSPCRFFPTCSSYALEAYEVHGVWRGTWLSGRRLVRCRPLGPSGVDLVPAPATSAPCSCPDSPERQPVDV